MLQFFFGVLFIFVFVVFMGQFSRIFTYAASYGADMLWVSATAVYLLPDILVLSIPMAVQVSIVMTLSSMSQSGEIMALRAAGFSFREITKPLFVIALFLCFLMFWMTGWVSPLGRRHLEEAKDDISSRITKVNIEPKTFINLGDWDIFAESVDKTRKILSSVHLSRKNDNAALSTKINAAAGKIDTGRNGINITLQNGQMQRHDLHNPHRIITAEFGEYKVFIPLAKKTAPAGSFKARELTSPQIVGAIKGGKLSDKDAASYRPAIAYRVSMTLSVIVLFFLSCPTAFAANKKAGRSAAMVYSIIFIFSYFGLLTVGEIMAKKFIFAPLAYGGPLLPVIIGAILSFYLWRRQLLNK